MKKEMSMEAALVKAEAYCAASEHCKADVLVKLQQWGVPEDTYGKILENLLERKYIDEARYAAFFVRDKYRFNQWGRIKIGQALRMKHVPSSCIAEAMEEIDDEEYRSILLALLHKKAHSVKASNSYERQGKLVRFAMGHGYEMEDIIPCIKELGGNDECVD